jgi:hypothetical protein
MDIVQRAKNICLTPATEWPVIAAESTSAGTLITGYVVPMAAIGVVAGLIGGSVIGRTLPFIGTYRVPILTGLGAAVFAFAMAIVGVVILSVIINALAPSFGGEKNSAQALKVAVYSYTPAWVAGVLQILPLLGTLVLLGALYGLYLLYLGLPRLMKCPEDKAVGYTAVVVLCAIVISVVIGTLSFAIVGTGMMGGMMSGGIMGAAPPTSGPVGTTGAEVEYDKNSALGKLQTLGKKLDESNKKMEAAQKKGDGDAAVAAALEGFGTLLGGGKRVDPVGIDQLKPFVPDTFAGLPKTHSNAEKNGIAGLAVSKAEATYSDGADKSVTLEISDTGGVSGLVGLASWATLQGEKDDDDRYERTMKVDGRLVHEERAKRDGGSNEFALILGDRFVVSAKGHGVDLNGLKTAVGGLDLSKLESMKDVGVQK